MVLTPKPALNLIKSAYSAEKVRAPGFYKSIGLDICSIASALVLGFFGRAYLTHGTNLWFALAALTALGVCSILQLLILTESNRRLFVQALEVIAVLVFFYDYSLGLLVVFGAICWGLRALGEILSYRETQNYLEIRLIQNTRAQRSYFLTAFALLAVMLYAANWSDSKIFISREMFQSFYAESAQLVRLSNPDFSEKLTVGEFLTGQIKGELANDSTFAKLTPAQQDRVIQQSLTSNLTGLSSKLQVSLNSEETVGATVYRVITANLQNLQREYGAKFFIVWGLVAFLILRSFGAILSWVISFIALGVYQLLIAMDFIRITIESRSREMVEYT